MTRKEEIEKAYWDIKAKYPCQTFEVEMIMERLFMDGAMWADKHPLKNNTMTKEEARELLTNVKIRTNGKDEEVLSVLYKLGFHWNVGPVDIIYPYLFTEKAEHEWHYGLITWSGNEDYFKKQDMKEMSAEYILAMEID